MRPPLNYNKKGREPIEPVRRKRINRKDYDVDLNSRSSGWEIIYSGFVLILLSFFIMLCSFASMEGSKISQFVSSFNSAVNVLGGGIRLDPGKFYVGVLGETVEISHSIAKLRNQISGLANELGLSSEIQLTISREGLVIGLPDSALFDPGVAEISRSSRRLLSQLAKIIAETSYPVRVEGHTDNIPISNERFPSNWELSTTRAVNVLRFFAEIENIPNERLSAAGFGEYKPIHDNNTPENRAQNRRVEIILMVSTLTQLNQDRK